MQGPMVKILIGAGALSASLALAASASAAGPTDVSGSADQPSVAASATGGQATGGQANGGRVTGGWATGGRVSGGHAIGGDAVGGQAIAGQSDADPAPAGQAGATTAAEQKAVLAHWTPKRMREATPIDGHADRAGRSALSAAASPSSESAPVARAGESGSSAEASRASTDPRLGKIFFTMNGQDHVCSGTVVHSVNHDVVTTAGHCLSDGSGGFASMVAFVPAYDDGDAPYGTWTAKQLYTTSEWSGSHDFNGDAGFAVMNEGPDGHSITYITGSYGIAFNQSRGLTYRSYGYPATSPYGGQHMYTCSGTAHDDARTGTSSQGMPCTMTAGSSGGGWVENGYVNSVNSYKYDEDPDTMYGPYFGASIKNAWAAASDYS